MSARKSSTAGARGPAATADPGSGHAVSGDLALIVSGKGEIISVPQISGRDADQLVGQTIDALWPPAVARSVRDGIRIAIRSRCFRSAEIRVGDNNNEFIFFAQGRDRALLLYRDATERQGALEEMRKFAYIDEITQMPNRQFLRKELDSVLGRSRLTEGRVALIHFHIDHVMSQGLSSDARRRDRILRTLARRLRQGLRGSGDGRSGGEEQESIAARFDFREFAVLLPAIDGGEDAEAVANRLIDSLEKPISLDEHEVSVTACAGIALFPQDGKDGDTLLQNAAAAVQDAQSNRADRIRFYSGTANLPALQRQDLELELRAALDNEDFQLSYLPIVDADSGRPYSVEALLRWPQTLFAQRSITKIVALAEHTGLIRPIGEWVLRNACRELKRWQAAGHADLRLAINLSVQELGRHDLPELIAGIAGEAGVQPAMLDVEITEYMLNRDALSGFATCNALAETGIGITVDDFGTGACALDQLTRAPIASVKIDNSLVSLATSNEYDRRAIAAAVALARELGVGVVAEGVETREQAELVRSLGCQRLQGYRVCKPAGADDMLAWLDAAGSGKP